MRSPARPLTRRVVVAATALLIGVPLFAHDMFLRVDSFFAAPNSSVPVRLFNGTFILSENSITPDRLADIAIVSPSGRQKIAVDQWDATRDTSRFAFRTGNAGTYVIGVSTKPRVLEMAGDAFNAYLASDGIPDELAARRAQKRLGERARERYQKHVKALLQVGSTPSEAYATVLGYPSEIVPMQNPYALARGGTLALRVLVDGAPKAGQFVQYGGLTAAGARVAQRSVRSDAAGVIRIPIDRNGMFYVKFIAMSRIANDAEADHESKWASLTFGVK
jgi:uncharacterized GH25 family protein